MQPFTRLTGIAVPLMRDNIDTDQIIPARFLTTVERSGLAKGLLVAMRAQGDCTLDQPRYAGASILITGANFGCGSSREHAPWALADFGIRCVIAPGFGDIFHANCFKNGLLPITLPAETVAALAREADGGGFTVDLVDETIVPPSGQSVAFAIARENRRKLIEGIDDIAATLRHAEAIRDYERAS